MTAQTRPATAVDRKGLSRPALRACFRIADLWSLSVEEQMTLLGVTARLTFFNWKRDTTLFCQRIHWSAFPTSWASTRHFSFCSPAKRPPMNG